jgi:preprotein translocase subunit SecG
VTLFVLAHIFICIFLVIVILLQPGKSDAGIGFGSSSQSIFGSKGAGNFLTKTTSICAIVFIFTSFWLTRQQMENRKSVVDIVPEERSATAPAKPAVAPKPAAPNTAAPAEKSAPAPAPLKGAEPKKK